MEDDLRWCNRPSLSGTFRRMEPRACVRQSKRANGLAVRTAKPLLDREKHVIRRFGSGWQQRQMEILQGHSPVRCGVVVLGPLNAPQWPDAGKTPLPDCPYRSIPGCDKRRTTHSALVHPTPRCGCGLAYGFLRNQVRGGFSKYRNGNCMQARAEKSKDAAGCPGENRLGFRRESGGQRSLSHRFGPAETMLSQSKQAQPNEAPWGPIPGKPLLSRSTRRWRH